MKSFRLDPNSVAESRRTWPVLVSGGVLAVLIAWFRPAWPVTGPAVAVLVAVLFGAQLAVGRIQRQIRQAYPGARSSWLLAAGLATFLGGFAVWAVFRRDLGPGFTVAWPGVSFVLILAFVLLNRKDPAVLR